MLADYQEAFISFALEANVLSFGEYTLKSGRVSPYFFNAGAFNSGALLSQLGGFYASALMASELPFSLLFGPAYKGIPLAGATTISLARDYDRDVPFAFNRKEAKDHGEGGLMVGAPVEGDLVIIDDVITAGTAIREVMSMLHDTTATVTGILVAIDRQEKGQGSLSAIQEVERDFGIPVISIVTLDHIVEFMQSSPELAGALAQVDAYRRQYGIVS